MTPEIRDRRRNTRPQPLFQRLGLTALIIGSVSWLTACASGQPALSSTGATVYRSKDYIVYESATGRSPEELAAEFLGDPNKSWMIKEANGRGNLRADRAIVIPLKIKNKGGLNRRGFQTVPVLTYHRFSEDCDSPLCMPARVFDEQMRYLKENGYHSVTPEELLAFLQYRQALPEKSVWITIDDGYRSIYMVAYPILKKYGFTATLFIYTEFVGVSRLAVTWKQFREMKANGFAIGSHTITHSDLTKPRADDSTADFIEHVRRELGQSKKMIDKKLGQDTFVLAYPFGSYDRRVINLAHEAGYTLAASVRRGGNPFFANPFALKRDQILKRDMATFVSRLKTFYPLALE
ncbi:MAG: polysaccharide deacetylase family protein [Desulfosarcina sp.]|nr:polysaccharide deacetylase family protein [Desulfobacterales bacterium]